MGQTFTQVLHSRHSCVSTMARSFTNLIAVRGHKSTQPPQPTHFSLSILIMFEPPEYILTHQLAITYQTNFHKQKHCNLILTIWSLTFCGIRLIPAFCLNCQASLEETSLCHQEMNFQGTFEYEFKFKILPFQDCVNRKLRIDALKLRSPTPLQG